LRKIAQFIEDPANERLQGGVIVDRQEKTNGAVFTLTSNLVLRVKDF
jgi:hypothetical protein